MWHLYTAHVGQRRQTRVHVVSPVTHPSPALQGWQFQAALKSHKDSRSPSSPPQHPAGHSQEEPRVGESCWSCWDVGGRTQSQEKIHLLSPLTKLLGILDTAAFYCTGCSKQPLSWVESWSLNHSSSSSPSPPVTLPSFKPHLNVTHTFAVQTSQKLCKRRASVCPSTHVRGVNNTVKGYHLERFLVFLCPCTPVL